MKGSALIWLSTNGALALGFFTAFVVSINVGDAAYAMFVPVVVALAWHAFHFWPQIQIGELFCILFLAAFFSWILFIPAEGGGAPSVLWLIPLWLPIVPMYFLRWILDRSLIDRINNEIGVLLLIFFFLGLGMTCGVIRAEPYSLGDITIPYSGTLFFLFFFFLFFAILLIGFLTGLKRKKKACMHFQYRLIRLQTEP